MQRASPPGEPARRRAVQGPTWSGKTLTALAAVNRLVSGGLDPTSIAYYDEHRLTEVFATAVIAEPRVVVVDFLDFYLHLGTWRSGPRDHRRTDRAGLPGLGGGRARAGGRAPGREVSWWLDRDRDGLRPAWGGDAPGFRSSSCSTAQSLSNLRPVRRRTVTSSRRQR